MWQPWEGLNGLWSQGGRVCGTQNARVFPCLDVMLGCRAKAQSGWLTGEAEKASGPEPSQGWYAVSVGLGRLGTLHPGGRPCYQPVPPAHVLPPTWGMLSGSSFPCLGELTSSPLSLLIVIYEWRIETLSLSHDQHQTLQDRKKNSFPLNP